jgi:hypothetical protein
MGRRSERRRTTYASARNLQTAAETISAPVCFDKHQANASAPRDNLSGASKHMALRRMAGGLRSGRRKDQRLLSSRRCGLLGWRRHPGSAGSITASSSLVQYLLLAVPLAAAFGLFGCSSSSVNISISPAPPTSLVIGETASLTANVTGDSSNAGVDWTVSCTPTGACGSFTPTHTNSGSTTTYTAPAAVPSNGSVTITATSTAKTTAVAQSTITITSTSTALNVSFVTPPPQFLPVNQSAAITAMVNNDTSNEGIDWTVTCASGSACGSLSPAHTDGGAFVNYTAPSAIPTGNTVTLTATSTFDPTIAASATITISAAGISVAFDSVPPASLALNTPVNLSATVTGDSANAGVDWKVTCLTAGLCGSFSSAHTASGGSTTYTAPPSIPAGGTVTITASSTANPSGSVSANVTIN